MMNFHKILLIGATILFAFATDSFAQKAKRPDTFYYRLGVEAFQQDLDNFMLYYFQHDLKENPENAYSQAYIGMIKCKNGQYEDALEILDTVIAKIPDKDIDFRNLIYSYIGKSQTGLEKCDEALRTFTKITRINPKDPIGYEGRGYLYLKMNDPESAEKDFNQAIKLDRKNVQSLLGLGHVELARGNVSKAIEKYNYVIEQFGTKCTDAYAYRAEAYTRLRQYENAASDIATSIESKNNKLSVNLLKGIMADSAYSIMEAEMESRCSNRVCYYQGILNESTGRYEKAIETYGKLLTTYCDRTAYLRLSACYSKLNNFAAAQYYAENGWKNDSINYDLTLQKAKTDFRLGHIQAASSYAERLIKIKPENEYSYYYSGYYESRNKQYGKALGNFTKAISLNPEMAVAYFERGAICQKYEQQEAAKADFEKVIELEKENPNSLLIFAYLNLGQTEKAEQTLNAMLSKNPNEISSLYNAASLYSRLGNENKAIEFLGDAFKNGFLDMNQLKTDSGFETIRKNESYKKLVAHYDSLFVVTNHLPETIYSFDHTKNPNVDNMPQFPGGESELLKYVAMTVKYPTKAREKGISGRVFVQFVVETDGSISNIQILRGICSVCDQEAYRVVKSMPKWKPGEKDGKKVRVQYVLPINFKLR